MSEAEVVGDGREAGVFHHYRSLCVDQIEGGRRPDVIDAHHISNSFLKQNLLKPLEFEI